MSEKATWTWFHNGVREFGGRWNRVENGVVDGMPDVNYCISGAEGWVELKFNAKNTGVRSGKGLFHYDGLSVDQINWHLDQLQNGGRVYIFAKTPKYSWLVHSSFARFFNDMTTLQLLECSTLCFPSRKVEWKKIVSVLKGESK